MTFTLLCEHLERYCGVAAPATLRARLVSRSVSIDPAVLDWVCVDTPLSSMVSGVDSKRNRLFSLVLLRTKLTASS